MTNLKRHWQVFVGIATVIGFVASVVTINTVFHPVSIIPVTVTSQSSQTPAFDFSLQGNWGSKQASVCWFYNTPNPHWPSPIQIESGAYTLTVPELSVTPVSGNPQSVRLYVEELPPRLSSVSFSIEYATPPFTSQLTIVPANVPPPSNQYTEVVYLGIAAESGGVVRTIVLPISFQACKLV